MDIGRNIRQLRIERGLSVADVAERAGISRAYFYLIENGSNSPTHDKLNAIAEALSVPASALFNEQPDDLIGFVIALKQQYAEKWRDKPESYWLMRLIQEIGELASALANDHEHTPDHELEQIASITLNWLEMRAQINTRKKVNS